MKIITDDLKARIEASKNWYEAHRDFTFDGHPVRGYPTSVRLVEYLDSPKRVERYGLGFEVMVRSPKAERTFQLNVRIKPEASIGPKEDLEPYVVVYVVNPSSGAEDEVFAEHFMNAQAYSDFAKLSIEDWYKIWLNRALREERGKFFVRPSRGDDA